MMQQRIFLSSPHMSGDEQEYIREAFQTNWIAPLGPHVDAFEKELAAIVGAAGAVVLSSGTAAIHLALKLAGVTAGDEVYCSSLTFAASANPILYERATPVFIDSDDETWNMSPQLLKQALQEAATVGRLPKAVIVVNLYGQSADMDPIVALCREYGVLLIEDAAESMGATYRNKPSGTLGDFGVYSFNGNKIITTAGGGVLLSNDLRALAKAKFWATQARDPAPHYQHSEIGYNYRMSNIAAAIGRGQLKVLSDRVAARRAVFQRYHDALAPLPGIQFMPEASYGCSNRWLTVMLLDTREHGVTPAQLMEELARENIEARPVWKPMHLQPIFANYRYYRHESESVSDRLFTNGLCLPSGSNLTTEEQGFVIDTVLHVLRKKS